MKEIHDLLKTWCDALLSYQIHGTGRAEFDGGLLCPACHVIHGRCPDLIYPLMTLYRRTGEEVYRAGAEKLFDWGENLVCDDGSMYNDAESQWKFITVFAATSMLNALSRHGDLLSPAVREKWEARTRGMCRWLMENLKPGAPTPVNYYAAGAEAMALAHDYFGDAAYADRARELAKTCMGHITENGVLYGEHKKRELVTETGCRPVDVGYNVEESLPSLYRYAVRTGDQDALEKVIFALHTHLDWMLPDGAWDNSFGVRNSKWTYWGSRTSDGCQSALFHLGQTEPVFAKAARRNLELYMRCTEDGLLHGGPDYARHGEKPCLHHAFCHAKVLAETLDMDIATQSRCELPSDRPSPLRFYPEAGVWRCGRGDWRMSVCNQNIEYVTGGHASGGALTLLWHKAVGPVIAAGMVDYSLVEPHNMQQSYQTRQHRTLAPRAELDAAGGTLLRSVYDYGAAVEGSEDAEAVRVNAKAELVAADRKPTGIPCTISYELTEERMRIFGQLPAGARYVLPIVARHDLTCEQEGGSARLGRVRLTGVDGSFAAEKIFNLVPGLEAWEFRAAVGADGRFDVTISIQ